MTPFDALDSATWPPMLTADQIALIYQRSVGAVKKACQLRRFHPAPAKTHPYRWRKVEIERDVFGLRMVPASRLQRAG